MKQSSVNSMLKISLFSALIAVSAMISIPFPIPITLQTFAIFLAFFTFGGAKSFAAVTVYTALGIVGLPVFAGFNSGVGYILGASGGFVIAFPISAILFSWLEVIFGKSNKKRLIYAFIALIVIYAVGCTWFALVYSGGKGFLASISVAVLPFIPFDILKLALAYAVAKRLKKLINI